MTDEPTSWELQRALTQIREDMRDGFAQSHARLDKLVTAEAFAAEQKRVDGLHKQLLDDIADEREARVKALGDEQKARQEGDERQQTTIDKLTTTLRWTAASIVLPIALFVATLLINTRGGA